MILSIGFYFRRLRAIPLTGIPAAIGATIAFGVAELAFGYLTESTSFLGSIIVGNGINYAIVLMSRYEEHRARGEDPEASLCAALAGVWRGTLVASICGLGRLRLAHGDQLPRLLPVRRDGRRRLAGLLGGHLHGAARDARAARSTAEAALPSRPPAARSRPRSARLLGAAERHGDGAVHVAVDHRPLRHAALPEGPVRVRLPQALREAQDHRRGAQQFNHSVDHLFGRWPSPTIVLADGVDEVEPIKQAIRRQDQRPAQGPTSIGQIVTI